MSNKFISFVVILLVFIAFIVVSVDRDESSTDRIAQMLPHTGNSTTPSGMSRPIRKIARGFVRRRSPDM
jgi:hypothetical protein